MIKSVRLINYPFGVKYRALTKNVPGMVTVLVISILLGVMIATESYLLLAVIISLPILFSMVKWPEYALLMTVIGAVLIPGIIELYLPQLVLIRWIFPIVSVVVSISVTLKYYFNGRDGCIGSFGKKIIVFALMFFMSSIFSSVVNSGFSINTVSGMKGYLQAWPIMFSFGLIFYNKCKIIKLFYKVLIGVGLIQIPIALHQFFFIVPMRMTTKLAEAGVVAIDVVAGTFGASLWGGGRSTTLGLFQILVITLVLLRYKDGLLSKWKSIFLVGLLLIPILISEIKVFPFLLLIMAMVLYRDYIRNFPLRAFGYATGLITVCIFLFMINFFLPYAKGQQAATLSSYIDEAVGYNFGNKGYGNSVLNRSTVYPFWIRENIDRGDILHSLIGYGAGATNSTPSVEVNSVLLKSYAGYTIGLTSISTLLWECGIVGTSAILVMFLMAIRGSYKLASSACDSDVRRLANFLLVGFSIFLLSLVHVNYFAFDLSYQTVLYLMLGMVIWLERINAKE